MDFALPERVAHFKPIVHDFVRNKLLPLEGVLLREGFAAARSGTPDEVANGYGDDIRWAPL